MKKKQAPKERNPYVQHARARKGGAHGKTRKAERRNNKVALKKEYAQ